ncbi:exosortase [Thalassotalea sediminis]|uniref:exosortase n=1 Tax=Thalassotalea sediminis TaxID=1759089 RepID=UPI0025732B00|nr:exosortase [Thalassotalea sediminis]
MRYGPLIVIAVVYVLIALSQQAILANIWQYSFDDGTYSHAYLIPVIVGYLYWVLFTEKELRFNTRINPYIVLVVIALSYLMAVFTLGHFTTGFRVTFVLFITAILTLIFKPTLKIIFPSLFLIFLIPVWGALTVFLQNLSTDAVTFIMGLSHIPIYVEGNFITIPAGVFEIAGGCSGLRYLIVSLAISSLYVFLYLDNLRHSLIFLSLAILGALLTNWLRITLLIVIGHITDMESSLMHDHNAFGWYLYIPFMFVLFKVGHRFAHKPSKPKQTAVENTAKIHWPSVSIALVCILLTSDMVRTVLQKSPSMNTANCNISLEQLPDLPLPVIENSNQQCVTVQGNDYVLEYHFHGASLQSSAGYFLNVYEPKGWRIEQRLENKNWNVLRVSKGEQTFIIRYAFKAGEHQVKDLSEFKVKKLRNAFKGEGDSTLLWKIQMESLNN